MCKNQTPSHTPVLGIRSSTRVLHDTRKWVIWIVTDRQTHRQADVADSRLTWRRVVIRPPPQIVKVTSLSVKMTENNVNFSSD